MACVWERLVELEREANEMGRAVCVVQFAESGAHPYLVSTRYRCVIGYVKRRVFVSSALAPPPSDLKALPFIHAHPAGMR